MLGLVIVDRCQLEPRQEFSEDYDIYDLVMTFCRIMYKCMVQF